MRFALLLSLVLAGSVLFATLLLSDQSLAFDKEDVGMDPNGIASAPPPPATTESNDDGQ